MADDQNQPAQNQPAQNQSAQNLPASVQVGSLFTTGSLATLQGSVLAAALVPAVLGYLIGPTFEPFTKWTAFIISIIVPLVIAYASNAENRNPLTWTVAVLNGFVIFASAVGIQVGASLVT